MQSEFGGSVTGSLAESSQSTTNEKSLKSKKGGLKRKGDDESGENFPAKMAIKYSFGCSAFSTDSIQSYSSFSGEKDINDKIVYKVGKSATIYDLESGKQFFLSGRSKTITNILHFSISSNSRYLSVCESIKNDRDDISIPAQISVYSLTNYSKAKTINHLCSGEFICSQFSGDAKHLTTLNDGQEYQIIIWLWEKEKVFKSISLQVKPTKISMHATHPLVVGSGQGFLRYWHPGSDGVLKPGSLANPSRDSENFVDHKWLSMTDVHRLAALSDQDGNEGYRKQMLYIYEGVDSTAGLITSPIALELKQTFPLKLDSPHSAAECIVPYSKGFMLVGRDGYVSFFDKLDDKRDPYVEVRTLSLGIFQFVSGTVIPSEEKLVLITKSNRIIYLPIGQSELLLLNDATSANNSVVACDLFQGGFHEQSIIACDIARHRSISATISFDNTLRIWNFETMKCELCHSFGNDDPIAMAIHPNGFQIVVSFKDKVRLYNILLDRLKLFKETAAKVLKEITFSYSGVYWAAASTINVVIYDTESFSQIVSLQGHMMSVRKLQWGPNDTTLFSAGADGNVYGWSLAYDNRIDVTLSSNRTAAIVGLAVDGFDNSLLGLQNERKLGRACIDWAHDSVTSNVVTVGTHAVLIAYNDNMMKLAEWSPVLGDAKNYPMDNSNYRSKAIANCVSNGTGEELTKHITVLRLSNSKKFVYAGTSDGCLRMYEWPFKGDKPPYIETIAHISAVVDVRESPYGNMVITCGEDGTVFFHSVLTGHFASMANNENAAIDLFSLNVENSGNYNTSVVQLAVEDIDEHVMEVSELKKSLEELGSKSSFESHQKENQHNEELKRIMDKHNSTLVYEKDRYEQLQAKMDSKVRELNTMLDLKASDFVKMTSELENRYEHKLADQLDRYDVLAEEMELLKQRCEGLIDAERQEFEKSLNDIKNETRQREKRMRQENKRIRDDRTTDESAFREILNQQDSEYEDELRQLISAAESELKSERENITKLRTLVQTKNTKLDQLKKKNLELQSSAKARQALLLHERKERQKLQDTIEHYKKNLLEREEALAEKEKTILDLRSSTRTLENFRFVLDHRLQQLSAERGPITQHIEGLERHIRTMYEELVDEFEHKKEDELKSEAKELRIVGYLQEISRLRGDNRTKDIYIATFRRELENVVGAFGQKELETAVKQLYRKFVRGEQVVQKEYSSRSKLQNSSGVMKMILKDGSGGNDSDNDSDDNDNGSLKSSQKQTTKQSLIAEIEEELIDNAIEATKQKKFVERNADNLQHRLTATRKEAGRVNKSRLNENSHLIFECNELRKEVKLLTRKLEVSNQALSEATRSKSQYAFNPSNGTGNNGTVDVDGNHFLASGGKRDANNNRGGMSNFSVYNRFSHLQNGQHVNPLHNNNTNPASNGGSGGDNRAVGGNGGVAGEGGRGQGGHGRVATAEEEQEDQNLADLVHNAMSVYTPNLSTKDLISSPTFKPTGGGDLAGNSNRNNQANDDIGSHISVRPIKILPQSATQGAIKGSMAKQMSDNSRPNSSGGPLHSPMFDIEVDYSKTTGGFAKLNNKPAMVAPSVDYKTVQKKDAQIEVLKTEIELLIQRIDGNEREKSMQRSEISRLRAMLSQKSMASTQPGADNIALGNPSVGLVTNKLKNQMLVNAHKYSTSDNLQKNSSDGIALGTKGVIVAVNKSQTSADLTGIPSDSDLRHFGAYNRPAKSASTSALPTTDGNKVPSMKNGISGNIAGVDGGKITPRNGGGGVDIDGDASITSSISSKGSLNMRLPIGVNRK